MEVLMSVHAFEQCRKRRIDPRYIVRQARTIPLPVGIDPFHWRLGRFTVVVRRTQEGNLKVVTVYPTHKK